MIDFCFKKKIFILGLSISGDNAIFVLTIKLPSMKKLRILIFLINSFKLFFYFTLLFMLSDFWLLLFNMQLVEICEFKRMSLHTTSMNLFQIWQIS